MFVDDKAFEHRLKELVLDLSELDTLLARFLAILTVRIKGFALRAK